MNAKSYISFKTLYISSDAFLLWREVVFYDRFVSQEIKSCCVSNNKGQIKKFPFLSLYKLVQVSIATFTKFAQFFFISQPWNISLIC